MGLWKTLVRLKRERDQVNKDITREISDNIGDIVVFMVWMFVGTCALLGYAFFISWVRFG